MQALYSKNPHKFDKLKSNVQQFEKLLQKQPKDFFPGDLNLWPGKKRVKETRTPKESVRDMIFKPTNDNTSNSPNSVPAGRSVKRIKPK